MTAVATANMILGFVNIILFTATVFLVRKNLRKKRCACGHIRSFHDMTNENGVIGACGTSSVNSVGYGPSYDRRFREERRDCPCNRYDGPDAFVVPMRLS